MGHIKRKNKPSNKRWDIKRRLKGNQRALQQTRWYHRKVERSKREIPKSPLVHKARSTPPGTAGPRSKNFFWTVMFLNLIIMTAHAKDNALNGTILGPQIRETKDLSHTDVKISQIYTNTSRTDTYPTCTIKYEEPKTTNSANRFNSPPTQNRKPKNRGAMGRQSNRRKFPSSSSHLTNRQVVAKKNPKMAFFSAIEVGDLKKVKSLISQLVDLNEKDEDEDGITPLRLAITYGELEIVKLLIEKGANINEKEGNVFPLLHLALICGKEKIAELLIKKGVKLDEKDEFGMTTLDLARRLIETGKIKKLPRGLDTIKCKSGKINCKTNPEAKYHFKCAPGYHSKKYSPVIGARKKEFQLIQRVLMINPILRLLDRRLYGESKHMKIKFPLAKKKDVDAIASTIYNNYLEKYKHCGVEHKNAVGGAGDAFRHLLLHGDLCGDITKRSIKILNLMEYGGGFCFVTFSQNPNKQHIFATAKDVRKGKDEYIPERLMALHELMHVEQGVEQLLTGFPIFRTSGVELMTALQQIIHADTIYKKIYGLHIGNVVDYGGETVGGIPLGRFANTYRDLQKKYDGNLAKALISKKSRLYLEGHLS